MIGQQIGRWGPVKYFLKDEYVGRSVHCMGEYNPDETEEILRLRDQCGSGLTLDIGANIGCISQALIYNGYNVLAFEPQPEVFKLLAENCKSAFDSVSGECSVTYGLMNCAVGSSHGWVKMPKVHYSERGNFGGLGVGTHSVLGNIDVACYYIDELELDEPVVLMKIDVEGYELEVLKGSRQTILRDRPILYIEDDRPHNTRSLREYILELGYTIETHQPPLYREDNWFKYSKNPWKLNYASHNIICKPIVNS